MKLKLSALVLSMVTLYILVSCGSGGNKDKSAEFDKAKSLDEQISDLISEDFPKPSEVPFLVMQTGAEYNQSLINTRDNIESYIAQPDKAALNLGIFAADMGYLASYEKTQESIDYFGACKRLADELGIMGSFSPEMVQQVEANIDNRDSLTQILDKAVGDASKYMNNSSQSKLGAMIITGSFVESLYLATGLVNTYPKSAFADAKQRMQVLTPLVQIILNQRTSVGEVSAMLKKVDQTEAVTAILKDFTALEASYNELAPLEAQIKKGDPNLTFTDETLAGVTSTIGKIRADIVK